MARSSAPDADLDRLYQVPLSEFIAERNAAAKRGGAAAGDIRALVKPTVPAWAVNQLYWRKRPVYDALIERADDLRATHQAAVKGRRTDLRGASRAHEEAVEEALKATLDLLADGGHPVTDATRQAIGTTLRSLPSQDAPGRLTRALEPRGFDVLAVAATQGRVKAAPPAPKVKPGAQPADKGKAAKIASAREALTRAGRAVRDAEHAARREEFEAARAARDAEKAERRVEEARQALEQAEAELDEAKKAAAVAGKAREGAKSRAERAVDQLADARLGEEAAKKALDALE